MKTIFDISNRNIGNQGMQEFIANFMQMSGRITELQLANNRIGPEGIKFLMETKWSNLKLLNLENNNIKLEGAKHLAHPSNGWKALEYLNLSNDGGM
jgi:Ran GTPase-activating protein (RanGAP) involved in mRNA processing and transport